MLNGGLKSLLLLWENLACNRRYSHLVDERDIKTFKDRVTNEGLPFLTCALPELGKALDTFHATNTWTAPLSFTRDEDGIPHFLGKAIRFAIEGNSVAVDCVRQLSLVFYKLEVPLDDTLIGKFLDHFIDNDLSLADIDLSDRSEAFAINLDSKRLIYTGDLVDEMRRIICFVLSNSDPRDIRPCHGTGATACRTPNHKKWSSIRYFPKLDAIFDYSSYFFFSATHVADELGSLEKSITKDPVARVCLVPKDSRGPRVISCEPAELMYIQQGLMRKLYEILETNYNTRGLINFTDQSINRGLAKLGSETDKLATLDLTDASDRVSLQLIRKVFPADWLECLEACRSEETILPNGTVVKLNKFAPMGSACCFPVEALVFWACAVAATRLVYGQQWPKIYVYGDDIICDSDISYVVTGGLESVGLLVNRLKSYVSGPFRESCGGDFHNGMDVTPVRVRHVPSKVGTGLDTCADLCNEFVAKFGYTESHRLIRVIEDAVEYVFPRTELTIPLSIRTQPSASNDVNFRARFNRNLQRVEHRVLTSTADVLQRRPPDWWELLRKELSRDRIDTREPYMHRLSVFDAKLDPGAYVDTHSTRKKWAWVWLG